MDSSVLIFDVSTFSLDHKAVKGWAPLTVRPTVPYPRGNRHYHLMLAINRDGLKAACLTKASVTAKDTVFFFSRMLGKMSNVKMVLLDNGPANSPKLLGTVGQIYGVTFVYNIANNPKFNPIESIFGVFKNKIRQALASRDMITPSDISRMIVDCGKTPLKTTIRYTLNNIE